MSATRIDFLRGEFARVRAGIDQIDQTAAAESRDLTPEEREQSAALVVRARDIGAELEPLVAQMRSVEATAQILAQIGAGRAPQMAHQPGPGVTDVSEGEYFASFARAAWPGNPNRQADLEAHAARFRTVATQTTADTSGLLPAPIVGPAVNFIDANRYVIPTLTNRPMPTSGKTFERPRITQHVEVGEQAAELDELASEKMTITTDTVTKRTFGGTVQMSQQEIDWTDPSALQLVFDDFASIYSKTTDATCATSLLAAATSTVAWTATSVGTKLTSFGNAAVAVYTAACVMPTDYWASLDEVIELATMTTADGDLVFPTIGNGRIDLSSVDIGVGIPLGLKLHVVPHWSSNNRVMGAAQYGEVYEDRKGFLQVVFPSVLKIELGYSGYLAQHYRSEGFVKLV